MKYIIVRWFLCCITALATTFSAVFPSGIPVYNKLKENEGVSSFMMEAATRDTLDRMESNVLNGAEMLVIKNGKTVFDKRYGYSDVEEKTEFKEDTIFRLASMSKPITAVAVMIQYERGLLSLDDKLSKYIPAFKDMSIAIVKDGKITGSTPAESEITLRQLLTHSSGLGSGVSSELQWQLLTNTNETLEQAAERYATSYLDFEPGTKSFYSALWAFDMLGRVVEITSGESYDEFLRKNIFEPLSMNDTFFNPSPEQETRITNIYESKDGALKKVNMTNSILGGYPTKYFSGAGGLLGTIGDYSKFALMLLNGGEYGGKRILSENSVEQMQTPQLDPTLDGIDKNINWGLGMRVITSNMNTLTKGSFGWSGAYGTHFWVDPENNMVALYFKNMTTDGGSGAVTSSNFEKYVMNAVIF